MPILILDVARAFWALRRDRGFVSLGLLLLIAITGGGAFYWQVENLPPLDAVYLSVITLTTVGYGDPAPETGAGKAFTAVFVLVGMGILLAFLSTMANQIRRQSVLRGPLDRLATRREGRLAPALARDDVRPVAELPRVGEYDLLVIGSDDASRSAAIEAAAAGLRVVLVDPEHVAAAPPRAA